MGSTEEQVEPPVLSSCEGGVARIVLNRPRVRNAVDDATLDAFDEAVTDASADPDCRVIVLSASGPVFCSGWDLRSIAATRERSDSDHARSRFYTNRAILDRYDAVPQVTVALVHGAVVGFGVSLLATSDIVLAAKGTRFSVPELNLGVVPALVMRDMATTLPDKLALDWLLAGDVHGVEEAVRGGLVTRCVDDLAQEGEQLVQRLAGQDRDALIQTRALYRRIETLDSDAATDVAIDVAVRALTQEAETR